MCLNYQGEQFICKRAHWSLFPEPPILLQLQPTLQVTASACVCSERSSKVEDKPSCKATKLILRCQTPLHTRLPSHCFLGSQILNSSSFLFFPLIQRYGSPICGGRTETKQFQSVLVRAFNLTWLFILKFQLNCMIS